MCPLMLGSLLALATRSGWEQQNGPLLAFTFVVAVAVVAVIASWRSRSQRFRWPLG